MVIQTVFNWVATSLQSVGSWAYDAVANTTAYIVALVK